MTNILFSFSIHPSIITCSKCTSQQSRPPSTPHPNPQEFIGHAMALYMNDEYMNQPAIHLINAVQLYANSLTHYENAPSP